MKNWANETKKIKSKGEARQIGQDFQIWSSEQSLSYGELTTYQNALYILAKKFGLVREFKENGII